MWAISARSSTLGGRKTVIPSVNMFINTLGGVQCLGLGSLGSKGRGRTCGVRLKSEGSFAGIVCAPKMRWFSIDICIIHNEAKYPKRCSHHLSRIEAKQGRFVEFLWGRFS